MIKPSLGALATPLQTVSQIPIAAPARTIATIQPVAEVGQLSIAAPALATYAGPGLATLAGPAISTSIWAE